MRKTFRWIAGAVFLLIAAFFVASGFSVYDYGLECTRCLREYHVVEKKFYGITYSKTQKLLFAGYDISSITASPCEHIYRTGGFGRENLFPLGGGIIGCGITAEGNLFRLRWDALREAFDLNKRNPDSRLLRQTIDLTDDCLPPDATLADAKSGKVGYLLILSTDLENSKSVQDWEKALANVKTEMASDRANWR